MTDFFTRLVSRTLTGLEPKVKPLIAPIYASGVTMADNYAVDPASELGFSVSRESDSEEYPMGQSPGLLGISAAETLSLASNITPINWEQIQLPNHPSEITSSEQVQLDNVIATESSIQTASSISGAIPPLDNSSEITSSEQLKSDSVIATESSITASSSEESSSQIPPSITPSPIIQKLSNQNTDNLTSAIQPLDNPSSEQLQLDNAIAQEESIKTSSAETSPSPITTSVTPPSFIQKSTNQNASNVTPKIQPLDNSSEGQLQLDNAIASRESIKTSSSEESSLPITSSVTPPSFIQKSTNQNASNVNPTVQPLDNSSGEQLGIDNVIDPESTIKTNSPERLSPSIQKLASQETVSVNPTIQPLDNSFSEQLEIDNAISPQESIKTSSVEASPSQITPSITPPNFIQQSSNQNTDNVNSTIQPLDNYSGEQLEIDNAILPEESIRTNSSEISSPSIQKLTHQDKVTPTVQSLDNSSDKQVVTDNVIAPKESIKTSSFEESSSPITPSITPSPIIQKLSNQNTDNVTSAIQPLDNYSGEQLQSDNAITKEESIKTSSAETSPSPITTSVTPPSFIQKSTNQNSSNVTPTIQPLDNSSDGKVQLDDAIAPDNVIKANSTEESSSPITTSTTTPNIIQKLSSSNVQSASSKIQPVAEIGRERSQTLSKTPTEPSSRLVDPQVVESSSSLQLNNQSFSERKKKVSLPLVKSEVMAPFSNSPLNLPEQLEPPVNRVESIQSIEINPALEANISATSSSLPQEDQQIFSRAPIASEKLSQSPGFSERKTGVSKAQSSSLESNALISSLSKPQQSNLSNSQEESLASLRPSVITTQSELVGEEVRSRQKRGASRSQQISESKSERIESNLSSLDNNINSLGDKYLATAKPRLSQTNGVTLTIKPRIENTHPELFQLPEKLSDFAFPSNSQLPPRQSSPTRGSEAAIGSSRKIANTTAESTPSINITIGRVEVRGVKPPDPAPVKKSRAKTPQLSLSDYLNQRGGISP